MCARLPLGLLGEALGAGAGAGQLGHESDRGHYPLHPAGGRQGGVYLLQHSEGKLPATGPRPGALPSNATLLAELRAGRQRLRAIFAEAENWLDAWLEELHDLACKAAAAAGEDNKMSPNGGGLFGGGPPSKSKAQQSLDQYMKTSCNIHAHLLLLLRNAHRL